MGLLDKLRGVGRGTLTAAKPDDGVPTTPPDELVRRLLAIQGPGIETRIDGDDVVVSWAAVVADVGAGGAGHRYAYRAIRIGLDPAAAEATGICTKTTTDAQLSFDGSFGLGGEWERGQHIGMELFQVVNLLGVQHSGGAAEQGRYTFRWSDLRDPVIETVTGAGWTYRPRKV